MTFSAALTVTVASDGAHGAPFLAALASAERVQAPSGTSYPVAAMAWAPTADGLAALCSGSRPALSGTSETDFLAAPDVRAVIVACSSPDAQAHAIECAVAARKHVLATLPLGTASRIGPLSLAAGRARILAVVAGSPDDVPRFLAALVGHPQALPAWAAPETAADALAAAMAALPPEGGEAREHLERALRLLRQNGDAR